MNDMINRHNSIAEENIDPNGRPATNAFEEWSIEIIERADDNQEEDSVNGPISDREKRLEEMEEIVKKDLE